MRSSAGRVIFAVFKREFVSYFRNPTGYVFITIFVFLSAVAAFWQDAFFLNNLANLDQLNRYFPYLLIFLAPAITMGLWAEEKKQGTEELLLTLPARDGAILLGKYFAALGIYTVALLFSLSHVLVLLSLGKPDPGMLVATYVGYWLIGAALLSLGLLASQMTDNLTVAFILGAVFCAIPVFLRHAGNLLSGRAQRLAEQLSVVEQFRDLSSGVVTASAITYFVALPAAVLYLCVKLAGRRRWPAFAGAPRMTAHVLLRALALLAAVASATVLAAQLGGRLDVTSEQIHSLSAETKSLIDSIDPNRPVFIQAYLSPEVPRTYLQTRSNLVAFLREFSAQSKGHIHARIVETVKYSEQAREARERYGIEPYRVPATEESASVSNDIFMGLVFSCGPEESVTGFFDRGLPVEYELMRSIRVVSRTGRRNIGVLDTGAKLFGGFDFETKRQTNDWSIVPELRKQYEVVRVSPDDNYPENLNVLIAALPHTLNRQQLERLVAYVQQGNPVLVLLDPLPAFNMNLSPAADSEPPASPFEQPPPAAPKVNLQPLLAALGVEFQADRIVWDSYNPHPQFRQLPQEVVFVGKGNQAPMPFQEGDEISSGLQEVVLLYPGALKPAAGAKDSFVPLMTTGANSGTLRWNQLVQRSIFGTGIVQGLPHKPDEEVHTLAARVTGKANAVVVADADMMSEQFFELRRRGVEQLNFDNVTFLLNAVDELAGDRSFIALRKRRPRHRTLETLEARTRVYEEQRTKETEEAQAAAERRLAEAQARLDAAVAELRNRSDLDDQTRQIMIQNLRSAEERRLQVARANVEDERDRLIENARVSMEGSVRAIQNTIKLSAVGLPPIPAFALFLFVSLRKLARERGRISTDRLVRRQAA
ncbi:MAG: Gldg family protein [Bryobacteraceae bacterium]|nr:Gldg family protein [Bryobacteraceae bacterium]